MCDVTRCNCCSVFFFFSSRRRHTRLQGDWSSDVCSSDLIALPTQACCPRGVFRRCIVSPWHAWRALLVSKPHFLAPKPQISCSKPQILNFKPQILRPKTPKRAQKSQTPIHSTEPPARVVCVFSLPNPFLAPKPQNSCLKPQI